MRGLVVSVVLSVVLFTAWANKPFDEKATALAEIQAKYVEVEGTGKRTLEAAVKEKNGITTKGEQDLLALLKTKINETTSQFNKDAKAIIRRAIVESKPVTVIHCVRNASTLGRTKIDQAYTSFSDQVTQIRLKKIEKIGFDISDIDSILAGLKELVEEAKTKINSGGAIETTKQQAIRNCQSAEILLGDIEVDIHEPILTKEYSKARQDIDKALKILKQKLSNELEKCFQPQP